MNLTINRRELRHILRLLFSLCLLSASSVEVILSPHFPSLNQPYGLGVMNCRLIFNEIILQYLKKKKIYPHELSTLATSHLKWEISFAKLMANMFFFHLHLLACWQIVGYMQHETLLFNKTTSYTQPPLRSHTIKLLQ